MNEIEFVGIKQLAPASQSGQEMSVLQEGIHEFELNIQPAKKEEDRDRSNPLLTISKRNPGNIYFTVKLTDCDENSPDYGRCMFHRFGVLTDNMAGAYWVRRSIDELEMIIRCAHCIPNADEAIARIKKAHAEGTKSSMKLSQLMELNGLKFKGVVKNIMQHIPTSAGIPRRAEVSTLEAVYVGDELLDEQSAPEQIASDEPDDEIPWEAARGPVLMPN